ncbi:MGT family glycosyltransferase [Pseudomonas duriflava]|uniref:MGT family glycosyltransferase n=1 Tax=Pseudomonas duriflava TaxID=459528 RepID=A0A562Q8D0_9PSED|nr:glycosyltransferase [Pseudomonas duriflava]TWI53015.1 MGT family glycosyltransferase [Pseudomonas duriflava]
MAHFAILCPPFPSHIRALEAIADVLAARGHRLTLLHQADVGSLIRSPAITFKPIGALSHPSGTLPGIIRRAGNPGGPLGLMRVIHDMACSTELFCREAPALLRQEGVDALITDQMEAAGGLVAEALNLPYISVACALPVNRDPLVPLPVMPWGYDDSARGQQLNEGSAQVYDLLMYEHAQVIRRYAQAFGLAPRSTLAECLSPYAQISQCVPGFDFPRSVPLPYLHETGPLRSPRLHEPPLILPNKDVPLRDDRPFVFASLGTLQGGRFRLFQRIARACQALDVQLLIAHCGGLTLEQSLLLRRAGAQWVTDFVPQRAVLAQADAVITHAGLNTVLDALEAGIPILALPIAFDQPGVAARVEYAGVGLRLSHKRATSARLTTALKQLLHDPRFQHNAQSFSPRVAAAGGAARAADIIEAVLRRPALERPA